MPSDTPPESPTQLAERLDRLAEKATALPWTNGTPEGDWPAVIEDEATICLHGPSTRIVEAVWHNDSTAGLYAKDDDLRLMANLRNAWPTISRMLRAGEACADELHELHVTVKGECPALLDEDRGGNATQDMAITAALAAYRAARGGG